MFGYKIYYYHMELLVSNNIYREVVDGGWGPVPPGTPPTLADSYGFRGM